MTLTFTTFLIVCPMLFLAGFVDSIGGGGGLISLPAYMLAGLPAHTAIATNKFSSSCGTTLTTVRFIKNKLINYKLAAPSVLFAIIGSTIGAHISSMISETIMKQILIILLPVIALIVLNKRLFHDHGEHEIQLNAKTYITAILCSLFIGAYDGFYGPGTGTFLIIAFTLFTNMSIRSANAQAKVINLTSNLSALTVFLINGQVLIPLGIAAAIANMIGSYIGSGLVMKNSSKVVKPIIILVLILLLLKQLFN